MIATVATYSVPELVQRLHNQRRELQRYELEAERQRRKEHARGERYTPRQEVPVIRAPKAGYHRSPSYERLPAERDGGMPRPSPVYMQIQQMQQLQQMQQQVVTLSLDR